MKCKHVQQHLLDYSESQLDRKTHAIVEEHLHGCSVCAQDLQDFEQTIEILHSTPLQAPPERFWDDFRSGVMCKIRRMDTPTRHIGSAFFSNMKMATVVLATCLLVLGVVLLYTSGALEERFPSLFQTSKPMLAELPKQQGDEFEAILESLISEELVDNIIESDFALLGGGGLLSLSTDANDESLHLLIESLDEREKTLLLLELEKMRENFAKP
ncbi:MAG: zf-HC2 domain-containing protein [bacterium]|nr:zf-HC2 domain-containing protein [bacterium]